MRVIGARLLTVLAVLLALVGMVAFYVKHTALDEQGFETISRSMIENDEIRTQVAAKSVDTLFENVDVEAAIAERLPPAQQGLAPVLAGLARSGADRAADAALERPRVQTVWVETTTRTQRQLVRLLDDDTTFIQTEGGAVVLDLQADRDPARRPGGGDRKGRRAAARVRGKDRDHREESAGHGADGDEGPARRRRLDVARRTCGRSARHLAGTRPPQDRDPALAIGLVVVGLLLLAVRRFAGDYLVDQLAKDDAVKPAAHDAWSILTQVLADRAWVWIILGLVTLLGVWFVGDTRLAAQARRAAGPSCRAA